MTLTKEQQERIVEEFNRRFGKLYHHKHQRRMWCAAVEWALSEFGPEVRDRALEEAAKLLENGSFLHDDAPAARLGREGAKAIRSRKSGS